MSRQPNLVAFMTPWNKPADDWSREKAAEMRGEGYADGIIIAKLEAYGIGLTAAQELLRALPPSPPRIAP
jgi:hypothetical protein